jgi:hypothetical protein
MNAKQRRLARRRIDRFKTALPALARSAKKTAKAMGALPEALQKVATAAKDMQLDVIEGEYRSWRKRRR